MILTEERIEAFRTDALEEAVLDAAYEDHHDGHDQYPDTECAICDQSSAEAHADGDHGEFPDTEACRICRRENEEALAYYGGLYRAERSQRESIALAREDLDLAHASDDELQAAIARELK